VDALQTTRAVGYENVILSNHGPELPRLVETLGLSRWIALTISSAAVGAEKPHRRIFEYALSATEAGPYTWMIGDNPDADVSGARQAGIRAILADGTYEDSVGVTVLQAPQQIRSSSAR
jgi:putative hydrolase of the HAD superfamily